MCKTSNIPVPYPAKFSDNFHGADLLSDGDGLCVVCNHVKSDRIYRMSNWVMSDIDFAGGTSTIHTFKHDDIIPIIRKAAAGGFKKPYVIYVTKTYKVQGWLSLMFRPNLSDKYCIVGFDREVVKVDYRDLDSILEVIKTARVNRWTKAELLTVPHTHRYENRELVRDVEVAKMVAGLAWDLLVYGDVTEVPKLPKVDKSEPKHKQEMLTA